MKTMMMMMMKKKKILMKWTWILHELMNRSKYLHLLLIYSIRCKNKCTKFLSNNPIRLHSMSMLTIAILILLNVLPKCKVKKSKMQLKLNNSRIERRSIFNSIDLRKAYPIYELDAFDHSKNDVCFCFLKTY